MEAVLRYRRDDLMNFIVRYMTTLGVPEDDARIVGKVLICADIRGVESHGMHRLGSYYGNRISKGYMNPDTPYRIITETDTTALIDGGNGLGQVVSFRAMEMAIEKAKKSGLAAITVKNSNHYGIAGYYAMMALNHDMIGISMTNSQPLVAPTYGRTAVLGTNPIAIAAPSDQKYPFLLDMATSAVAYGKIQVYEKKQEKIPIGWGIDEEGVVTNDPSKIKPGGHGALLPLGGMEITAGYKGYGMAVFVEVLCSILSGGNFLTRVGGPSRPEPTGVSHFFMAFNINAFRPVVDFKAYMDEMITELKNAPLAVGREEILVAGEKEFHYAEYNCKHGVPLILPIVQDLRTEGEKIGVPFDLDPVTE
jgi:LDH2 family malate/lactate/ureidoglycolate dehydrogenase